MKPLSALGLFGLLSISLLLGCRATPTPTREPVNLHFGGADSLQFVTADLISAFAKSHPNVHIDLRPTNSDEGLSEFAHGSIDLALVSRNPRADELSRRPAHALEIGRDGIVIIVHPSNPVTNSTREQIAEAFAGEIIGWSQFGIKMTPESDPIEVISREAGSGTRSTFEDLLMAGRRVTPAALIQSSEPNVFAYVASHPGATGYASFNGWRNSSGTRAISVEGVSPDLSTIRSEKYPLLRTLYFVVPDVSSPDLTEFVDYVQSAEGRAVIESRIVSATPKP